jgi:hypothetical protein
MKAMLQQRHKVKCLEDSQPGMQKERKGEDSTEYEELVN